MESGPSPTFETARLRARPLAVTDQDWLDRLHRDEDVMAFFGGVRTGDAQAQWVENHLRMFEESGFGIWIFEADEADQPIGRATLRPITPELGLDLIEVGYALARSAWGRGYATEMSRAMVARGFACDLPELGAIVHEDNFASQRVLSKSGFTPDTTHDLDLPEGRHQFFHQLRPANL